jgi:hypothetical protein
MQKNYYVVLGIAPGASPEEIKAAFRRRVRELHPDVSGLNSGPFIEVQEAYAVLSDPERRQRYDREVLQLGPRRASWPPPEPLVRERPAGEPFRPSEPLEAVREVSLVDSFQRYVPSFDELFDRLWSNFGSLTRPKAETLQSLTVETVLSPEQARWGGQVRVWVPARATCWTCGGHGSVGGFACWRCAGRGALATEYPVDVHYPAGVREGYTVRIPLDRFGIQNFYLTVWFRVSEDWAG